MKKQTIIGICALFALFVLASSFSAAETEEEPRFEPPILLTSAGQSAEVQLAAVLLKRTGLAYDLVKTAEPKDLAGKKTLIFVLGTSLKGLGAAGLDLDQEKKRVGVLLDEAKAQSTPIMCLHLGGEARRGTLSDELIEAVLPSAQAAIVVITGNKDGFFTQITEAGSIPLIEVERAADALQPLKDAFQVQ